MRNQVEQEVEEEDINAWDDFCRLKGFGDLVPAKAAAPAVDASVDASASDGKSATQKLAEEIKSLKASVQENLGKFQQQCTNLKVIRTKSEAAADADMLGNFVKALGGSITKTQRLVGMLEKMLVAEVDDSMVPKLLDLVKEVDSRYSSSLTWADKFGCGLDTKAKRQRK